MSRRLGGGAFQFALRFEFDSGKGEGLGEGEGLAMGHLAELGTLHVGVAAAAAVVAVATWACLGAGKHLEVGRRTAPEGLQGVGQ